MKKIFGMVFLPRCIANSRKPRASNPQTLAKGVPRRILPVAETQGHIGGVSPSRPTLTRLVSNEPSGSFFVKAITLAPGLRSDLSAGT